MEEVFSFIGKLLLVVFVIWFLMFAIESIKNGFRELESDPYYEQESDYQDSLNY